MSTRQDPAVGYIHSIQSLGTVDGPGVRFVAFLQGCPLRCGCCHNPDTWEREGGTAYTPQQLVEKAERYRAYFGTEGGITLSGGEPLLQAEFVYEVFSLCQARGISTCLDTSGCLTDESALRVLEVCDRVLLDIKYASDEDYHRYVGCSMEAPLAFLSHLQERGVPTTLRQVTIPTLNDTEESVSALLSLAEAHSCVDHIELLPFRKICQVKYDNLQKPFRFAHLPEPSRENMARLEALLYRSGRYGK